MDWCTKGGFHPESENIPDKVSADLSFHTALILLCERFHLSCVSDRQHLHVAVFYSSIYTGRR